MAGVPIGMGLKKRLSNGCCLSDVTCISSIALISELQKATTAAQAFYSEGEYSESFIDALRPGVQGDERVIKCYCNEVWYCSSGRNDSRTSAKFKSRLSDFLRPARIWVP